MFILGQAWCRPVCVDCIFPMPRVFAKLGSTPQKIAVLRVKRVLHQEDVFPQSDGLRGAPPRFLLAQSTRSTALCLVGLGLTGEIGENERGSRRNEGMFLLVVVFSSKPRTGGPPNRPIVGHLHWKPKVAMACTYSSVLVTSSEARSYVRSVVATFVFDALCSGKKKQQDALGGEVPPFFSSFPGRFCSPGRWRR